MSHINELKQQVIETVDGHRDRLIGAAKTIHANPELAFEEHQAAALLSGILEEDGFAVERGIANMATAFAATLPGKNGGPRIAFLAEYDALAGLGHACGHNLIATMALGAGLGIKSVLSELAGTIQVIGTPAEEGGGGKVFMVDAGVFDDVDAVIMIHPSAGRNMTRRGSLTSYKITMEFFGKPAHAAAKPDDGINALDALILTYNGISALRQHVRSDVRIHGIISHGGDAANVVPEYTAANFIVRSQDNAYTREVIEKVRACAEGGAQATGATLKFTQHAPHYETRITNPVLADLFEGNMAAFDLPVTPPAPDDRMGSSDIGNVSHVVPSIHAYLAISPDDIGSHTAEFQVASGSQLGLETMLKGAKIMAMTALDLLTDPAKVAEMKRAFTEQTGRT